MVFWDAVIAVRVVAACGHVERERPPGAQYGSTGMPCQRPSSAIGLGRRDRATGQAPRGSCSGGVPKDITARWPTRCGARGPGLLHLTHADLLACLTRACASQVLMDRLICRVRDGRAGRLPAIDGRFDPPAGPSCWHNSQGGSGFDSPRRAGGGTASLRAAVVGKHFGIRRRRRAGCCPPAAPVALAQPLAPRLLATFTRAEASDRFGEGLPSSGRSSQFGVVELIRARKSIRPRLAPLWTPDRFETPRIDSTFGLVRVRVESMRGSRTDSGTPAPIRGSHQFGSHRTD